MAPLETWNGRSKVIKHLLGHCGGVVPDESVLIICEASTRDLANAFAHEGQRLGANMALVQMAKLERHGMEPSALVARQMLQSNLTVSLCQSSLAHSKARKEAPGRFLSLPQYSWDLLDNPSIAVDYEAQAPLVRRFADAFTNGREIRVTTQAGTDVTMAIAGRIGNACPGFVRHPGDLGSPPDIEANVAPIEDSANGFMVADSPELIRPIKDGRILAPVHVDPKHTVLGECGVGLNPLAKICGNLLIDEGAFGAVHFGFGSNRAHGGQNETDSHIDYIMADASLWVDDIQMLNEGQIC